MPIGIEFYNVNTRERRICDTEPMIAAFWASSDLSPNANKGQDYGWRIGPEIKAELDGYKKDPAKLQYIAQELHVQIDMLTDSEILFWMVDQQQKASQASQASGEKDYTDEYNQEVAEAKAKSRPKTQVKAKKPNVAQSKKGGK